MNWNGGALARANLKRKFNENRQNNRRNFVEPRGQDENEAERRETGTAPNANPNRSQGRIPTGLRQGGPNDRALDGLIAGRQHQDYAALGFDLLKPQKYERRVVPLLEFLEKKFPKGHILSLQLSHQMDITRALRTPATSNLAASTSRNDTANTSAFFQDGGNNININRVANVTMNTSLSSGSSIVCPASINSESPSAFAQTMGRSAGGSGARPT